MEVTPFELERLLEKKMAERAVQNLIGRFCHLNTARRDQDILDIWSKAPDARIEQPWGVYDGPEGVRRFFTEEEKQEIRGQIIRYRRFAELIAHGDYYRLNELEDMAECSAWMFVSPDRKEALVSMVMTHLRANGPFPWFRLQGLMPDGVYALEVTDPRGTEMQSAGCVTGAALMQGGYAFPYAWGDYRAMQLHLTRVN